MQTTQSEVWVQASLDGGVSAEAGIPVPSRSVPGKLYLVKRQVGRKNEWTCNCPKYIFSRNIEVVEHGFLVERKPHCHHIAFVVDALTRAE